MNLLQSLKDNKQFGDITMKQVTNAGQDLMGSLHPLMMLGQVASMPKNTIEKAGKDIGTRGM
ncbi:MAG: hypothetical protein FWE47_00920 [Oscillospiraceae bacterium]|nr:hypothetical protein [Oscillospiraceae bacterium]